MKKLKKLLLVLGIIYGIKQLLMQIKMEETANEEV